MGRYDRIKVFNGSSFVQPSRIRVFSGGTWKDLGVNDSSNTSPLYVYKSPSNLVRATLNRQVNTVVQPTYLTNQFSMLPVDRFCFYPKIGTFQFECDVMKTTSAQVTLLNITAASGKSWFRVYWMADGRIYINGVTEYGVYQVNMYSSNAIGANQLVHLRIYAAKGSDGPLALTFNGVTVTINNAWSTFMVTSSTNYIGGSSVRFFNNLTLAGVKFVSTNVGTLTSVTMNTGSTSSSETSKRSGGTNVNQSYETISWV